MTDNALKIIKDELEWINEIALEVEDIELILVSKAISVAVESLKHYDHQKIKATKTPCGTGEMANDALTTIANILSGGTVASLNEDKK